MCTHSVWTFYTAWPFTRAWPFKYVNGVQTPESAQLGANPLPYIPTIPDIEEALL